MKKDNQLPVIEEKIIKCDDVSVEAISNITENDPNAGILVYALKNLGYDNYSAIYDLIDNCIDAEATLIKLVIEKTKDGIRIIIIDNGHGMNIKVLDQALRLGSDTDRNNPADLGKFGMGASTASLSLSNITTMITKSESSEDILESSTDVNEVIKNKKFIKTLGKASTESIEIFNKYLKDQKSGTIIILSECVGVKNKNIVQFTNKLVKDMGRIYRKFLDKITFYVNDKKVELNDPLWLDHEETEVFSDDVYEIKYKDSSGVEKRDKVRIKLVLLPDFGQDLNRQNGFNLANQGLSIMRNNREICFGFIPSNWMAKHPKLNRFRGELSFDSQLDEPMGVDFRKKGIEMDESIEASLRSHIKPQITAIGNKAEKKIKAKQNDGINHDEAAELIGKKAHTLITPKVEKERRESRKDKEEKTSKDNNDNSNGTRKYNKSQKVSANVRFETVHYGRGGNIFTSYQEGRTTVIEWNVDHPFYERFVISNKDDKTLVTSVDFLIYSLAVAQNQALGDDDNKAILIESMLSIMSANMRALLS